MIPTGDEEVWDIVLRGARVIDPGSGIDAVRDVAVHRGRIVRVSAPPLNGRSVVEVSGFVVCPGFIDMHSHGQRIMEQRLQALDGVTVALELESGAHPVEHAYRKAAEEGRPIHYGFSTSWAMARMRQLTGTDATGGFSEFLTRIAEPGWQGAATAKQVRGIVDRLGEDLAAGALGIGVLLGYAPDSERSEYLAIAELAASRGVIAFTHSRDVADSKAEAEFNTNGVGEIIRVAGESGAHVHCCHINSITGRHVERVIDLIERARRAGSRITTEAYPYGSGMTGIGAPFLAPDSLPYHGLVPGDLRHASTGERVADAARLEFLRRADPAALCFIDFLREHVPEDVYWIERALISPGTAIASDALPLTWPHGRPDEQAWPPPAGAVTHPRSAGTFGRILRLARERRLFDLPEAIARCTIIPARILEPSIPAMARKARIQAGCDADIVVFDPDVVSDQATYTDMARPTTGIRHVLVDGVFVVRDGTLRTDVLPGKPIRAAAP